MRMARAKMEGEGVYHVISRIGGRRFLMDDGEKRRFLGMIRRVAEFSGVQLYTYAMMGNHFHLLVRVPERRDVSDGELLRRMRALYGAKGFASRMAEWEAWRAAGQESRVAEAQARYRARMHDLSEFCKTFKGWYTRDYNRRAKNTGTIWEERFKSVIVEPGKEALLAVSAYIHLNPVRAKMASGPSAAWNTGYGAACTGDAAARAGLSSMVSRLSGQPVTWAAARAACEAAMEGDLAEWRAREAEVRDAQTPQHNEPPLGMKVLLRTRVAEFSAGRVLGNAAFLKRVEALFPPRKNRVFPGLLARSGYNGLCSAARAKTRSGTG